MNIRTAVILGFAFASVSFAAGHSHWIVTWGASASPQQDEAQMRAEKLVYENQTLREIVHSSVGGDTVRVRL